ncbi:hypothetical protein BDV26DRAFT_253435 [Aspergillus bertholletiae]|uniref:Uncharacterized protein n=1 Tax=Aspergillus bertholletiae TaxID=1226010 RepID=A0A5N7BKU4_9EURO|nr:hypothetical protein BDV26DRAFT_253435 [Aspergillus bertholletiae]
MISGGFANGVIFVRPLDGKKSEVDAFLTKNLQDIRDNVPGVRIAYHFWVREKNQFVVVESFESTQAMFNYGNSEYHEGLVSQIIGLVEKPLEALSDQDSTEELHGFRKSGQAAHINV